MPLGLAIAGPLSDRFGANVWFLVGGVAAIVLGALAFFVPAVMNLEEQGAKLAAVREAENGSAQAEEAVAESPLSIRSK